MMTPGGFQCSFGDIGELQKIRIESDNYGSNPSWLIDTVSCTAFCACYFAVNGSLM